MKTIFKAAPFILSAAMMAACVNGPAAPAQNAEAAPAPVDTTDYTQPIDQAVLTIGRYTDGGMAIAALSFRDKPITLGTCKVLGEDSAKANSSNSETTTSITCLNDGKRVGNFIAQWPRR
jgi:hypothetical protein